MCSAQLCPGSREHISRQQIFQLLWKVEASVSDTTFLKKILIRDTEKELNADF